VNVRPSTPSAAESAALVVKARTGARHFCAAVNRHLELGGNGLWATWNIDGDLLAGVPRRSSSRLQQVAQGLDPNLAKVREPGLGGVVSRSRAWDDGEGHSALVSVKEPDGYYRNHMFFYTPTGTFHGLAVRARGGPVGTVFSTLDPRPRRTRTSTSKTKVDVGRALYSTI